MTFSYLMPTLMHPHGPAADYIRKVEAPTHLFLLCAMPGRYSYTVDALNAFKSFALGSSNTTSWLGPNFFRCGDLEQRRRVLRAAGGSSALLASPRHESYNMCADTCVMMQPLLVWCGRGVSQPSCRSIAGTCRPRASTQRPPSCSRPRRAFHSMRPTERACMGGPWLCRAKARRGWPRYARGLPP